VPSKLDINTIMFAYQNEITYLYLYFK